MAWALRKWSHEIAAQTFRKKPSEKIRGTAISTNFMKLFLSTCIFALAALIPAQAQTNNSDFPGSVPDTCPTAAAPIWGKLVVAGNVVTCYYANGTATPTSWISHANRRFRQ